MMQGQATLDAMGHGMTNRTAQTSNFKEPKPYGCGQAFDKVDINSVRALYPNLQDLEKEK